MTGSPQAVEHARELIQELVNSMPQGRGGPGGGGFGPTEVMLVHSERVCSRFYPHVIALAFVYLYMLFRFDRSA